MEVDHDTLRLTQPVDVAHDPRLVLAGGGHPLGIGEYTTIRKGPQHVGIDVGRAMGKAPTLRDNLVSGHAVEPGRECGLPAKGLQLAKEDDENLLRGILGLALGTAAQD